MEAFGLNSHHDDLILNYLRFAKFQRAQCKKTIEGCIEDAKDTRLVDDTYTVDEVQEIIEDITKEVLDEVDNELLNSSHTNVLLLQQVFKQAQKWHLNLDADLAELENRELLDKVKAWENEELKGASGIEKPPLSSIKKLAPLNEGGPVQLLQVRITQLDEENEKLRQRLKTLEGQATEALKENRNLVEQIEDLKKLLSEAKEQSRPVSATEPHEEKELEDLSETVKAVKLQMESEKEINEKTQQELESDLTATKHQLLDVQHQLQMAETELERKFSQTGAYKNFKKMLSAKNEQIRELRSKLKKYEDGSESED